MTMVRLLVTFPQPEPVLFKGISHTYVSSSGKDQVYDDESVNSRFVKIFTDFACYITVNITLEFDRSNDVNQSSSLADVISVGHNFPTSNVCEGD